MIEFDTIFDFKCLGEDPERPHLLVINSPSCRWCEKFKSEGLWEALEEHITPDGYEICLLDVEKIGGDRTVRAAFKYFLDRPMNVVGYPMLWIINNKDDCRFVKPVVYWDPDGGKFKAEGLIEHIRNEKAT